MEKGRKFVVAVGVLVLFFMAWIGWIIFKSPVNRGAGEAGLPQTEMSQLRQDLSDFIGDRLKKERPESELLDIALEWPIEEKNGLKVPYTLSYRDPKLGINSAVHAIALLEKTGELWKVTKVLPQKETITYEQNETVGQDK